MGAKSWCAEQDSNLHQAEFESAASAGWAISACPPRESNPQLASGLSRWPLPLGYAGLRHIGLNERSSVTSINIGPPSLIAWASRSVASCTVLARSAFTP